MIRIRKTKKKKKQNKKTIRNQYTIRRCPIRYTCDLNVAFLNKNMTKKKIFVFLISILSTCNAQNWFNILNQFNPAEEIGNMRQQSTPTAFPTTNRNETVYDYPCDNGGIVQMTRPGGQLTPETNYWDGRVDLTDYTYLKAIKLVIKVDQAAEITVDPAHGTVSGPKTGKIFRVTYEGAPPDVNLVYFHIKGLQRNLFPNLVSLYLNNREICKNANTVRFHLNYVILCQKFYS